jgi:hypothetical protein
MLDTILPAITFTWYTPSNWSTLNSNNFITETEVYDQNWLYDFDYVYNWNTRNVYDSWVVLMYNFNNVSSLWESWTYVRDFSLYWKDWLVSWWTTWISSWVWNWAYKFDWVNDYVSISTWIALWTVHTISMRVKPSSNVWALLWKVSGVWLYLSWNKVIYSLASDNYVSFNQIIPLNTRTNIILRRNWSDVSLYVNWNISSILTLPINTWFSLLYIWKENDDWSNEKTYSGSIDELFIYSRAIQAINPPQIYRENFAAVWPWKWLHTSNYTCVVTWWNYIYTWFIYDRASNNSSTNRSTTINLPSPLQNISASSLDMWQMKASLFSGQTVSWQSDWYFSVADWKWNTGWYSTITLPLNLRGNNSVNNTINNSNIYFQSIGINTISGRSTDRIYVVWNLSGYINAPNATTYIKRDPSDIPFMCPGWTYGNKPSFKVDIPAWQAIDSYSGSITYDIIY